MISMIIGFVASTASFSKGGIQFKKGALLKAHDS